jgi:hypothetical protein
MSTYQYIPAAASAVAGFVFPAADDLLAALESLPVVELETIVVTLWFCGYCGEEDGSPVQAWDSGDPDVGCSGGFVERCTLCAYKGGR